jgi:polysaccharide chain length determinant protein (PEP-CTERM system associated)
MDEAIRRIISEFRSAWRFRWWAVGLAWIVCIVGWIYIFGLPDEFEANARFYVDTTTRLDEVISGITVKSDDASQISLVRSAMLSDPSIEAVARETDLDLQAMTEAQKQGLIAFLKRRISVTDSSNQRRRRGESEGIFDISFRYTDRQKAYAVVDVMLDNFREDVISGRAQGSEETIEFLEREIADYRARLEAQERAIADYRAENVGLLPGETGGYFDILQERQDSLRELEAEYSVLLSRRAALMEQLRGERPMLEGSGGATGGGTNAIQDLDQRISDLEADIDDLLTQYTESWPDVVNKRDQLEQLRKRRDELLAELAAAGQTGGSVPSNNPVYQQLQISLNATILEISEIEQRLATLRAEITALEGYMDVAPEIEAGVLKLTRDLDELRTVYAELRKRLEQEQLRQKRLGFSGANFRVIDPPKVSTGPVAPRRLELILLVVVAGLGAGAGLAYLLQMLRPVFVDQGSLREITGLPVLGAVSMAHQAEHRGQRRRELLVLAGVTGMILVMAVFAVLFMDFGVKAAAELRQLASL